MTDLLIEGDDLVLDGVGRLQLVSGDAEVLQRIRSRLRRWAGEWFADRTLGVPYRRDILRKAPDVGVITSVLRAEILGTRGVSAVTRLSVTIDPATRALSVSFEAATTRGLVSGGVQYTSVADPSGSVLALDDGSIVYV